MAVNCSQVIDIKRYFLLPLQWRVRLSQLVAQVHSFHSFPLMCGPTHSCFETSETPRRWTLVMAEVRTVENMFTCFTSIHESSIMLVGELQESMYPHFWTCKLRGMWLRIRTHSPQHQSSWITGNGGLLVRCTSYPCKLCTLSKKSHLPKSGAPLPDERMVETLLLRITAVYPAHGPLLAESL